MKEEVSILIIDDTNQESNKQVLELRLKKICTPRIEQILTNSIELRKEDGSDHLDPNKLTILLKEKLCGNRIDWIVTDFNLGEEDLDGIDVIRIMQRIRPFRHKNVILYSGNIQSAIKKVINETNTADSEDAVVHAVVKFIDLPIFRFEGRQDYKDTLVDAISKKGRVSLEERLLKLLHTHGNLIFNSCFPPFEGKTFGEIADIIENESDARGEEWLQELIEQIIAYLIKVNE